MPGPYRFGHIDIRPDERQLLVDGKPVALGARAFDVALALVERRDRVVPKTELFDLIWPGLVVEENNLQVHISALRKVLGPQSIATIPGRGYRFAATLDLDGDGKRHATDAMAVPPVASNGAASRRPSNLPAEAPILFGRETDLAALRTLLDKHRFVTIVGAGGIGKSRLAQAAAHAVAGRWSDGACMVELAGLSDPALLPNTVAQGLRIAIPDRRLASDALINGIADQSMLLVLDNCEHLLDAAAALVQAILQAAPKVSVLTTSQEPLRLPAEQQYRLVPLAVPVEATVSGAREFGAVELFEARVRAADPRFALGDEDLATVVDICSRLDGLPLAIELAAARVTTLGLRPVRDKLDARFKLLSGGSRATLRRHQTLRAALEWSHHLLNDGEKAVFRRLGVFAGGFTIELAQAVSSDDDLDEWAVLDILSALVDKSLVVAEAGAAPRYRLLESSRAFALEQLAAGETAEVLKRHALAMRDFMQRIDGAHLDGDLRTDQLKALMIPELDNLRAAREWALAEAGDLETAIVLAAGLSSLEEFVVESGDWLVPLQRRVETDVVAPAIAARYWRAMTSTNMSDRLPRALQVEAASRAQALYSELGQPRRAVSSLTQLAHHQLDLRRNDEAQAAADEARALIGPDWPAALRIRLLRVDCYIARNAGRFDEALHLYRDAVRLGEASGDWLLEMMARGSLARLLWQFEQFEDAACEGRALAEELRARPVAEVDEAWMLAVLIGALSEMNHVGEATTVAERALPLMRRSKTYHLEVLAALFWRRGQLDAAARLLGASDAERARIGDPLQLSEQRLVDKARAALTAEFAPRVLAGLLTAGAVLSEAERFALISEALARSLEGSRR